MSRFVLPVLFSLFIAGQVQAAKVDLDRKGEDVTLTVDVQNDFAGSEAVILSTDANSIEIRIAGADFGAGNKRQLFRFEDADIKAASLAKDSNSGIVRFSLKNKTAARIAEQIQITRNENGQIQFFITDVSHPTAAALEGVKSVAITNPSDNHDALATTETSKLSVGDAPVAAAAQSEESQPLKKVEVKKESEIPLALDKKEEKKSASAGIERLVMTLFIICAFLGAALFGLKQWAARRSKVKPNTKIQILTQHHLGPKKSIAIVQVAGEAILVGITDHNISMLKTLALIDDEVPGHVPRNFADEMDSDITRDQMAFIESDDSEPENFAMRGIREVRDLVSTARQMR